MPRYGPIYSRDVLLRKSVVVCGSEHVKSLLAAEHNLVECES